MLRNSLGAKVLILLCGSTLTVMLISFTGFQFLSSQLDEYERLIRGPLEAAELIDRANVGFKTQVQEWKNVLLRGRDSKAQDRYWQQFQAEEREVQQALEDLAKVPGLSAKIYVHADILLAEHRQLGDAYRRGREAFIAAGADPFAGDKAVSGIDRAASETMSTLVKDLRSRADLHAQRIAVESKRVIYFALGLILAAAALVALLGVWLANTTIERKRAEAVAQGQRRALELAMTSAPLEQILDLLCRLVEEQAGGRLLASIMLLDTDRGRLRVGAAPSLPVEYNRSVDGLAIGPSSGSCGTAAFLAEPIVVTDIEHDERWHQFSHLALPHGLRACWSVPLLSTKGAVQGTMALYSRETRGPTEWEFESIALLANTASLIIERYRETQERNRAELRFRSLVSATNAIVWTTSKDVEVFTPQLEWASFTGFTADQVNGMGWLNAIHPDDHDTILRTVSRMRQEAAPLQDEVRLRRADGEFRAMELHVVPILDASGALKEWAGSYTDITERRQSEKRLHHLATHDALTGLPNRTFLNEHLQELLDFTPPSESIAVMLIDLDRFKHINDSMGHDSGDELLCHIAKRLQSELPAGDLVARLGGDEFVIVAHALHGKRSAKALAEKLVKTFASPLDVDGSLLFSSASIGICLYPENGQSKDILLQNADIAMYKAKADGGNRYSFFSEEMSVAMKKRMALEIALRGALDRGEFVLHYQPRVSLPDERLRGVEALIRWNSPERGVVSPLDFIPIAEETGLINEIGAWVLRQACADIQALSTRMGYPLCVSVNLSPRQLMCPNLVHEVKGVLHQAGMRAEHLELELTEGAFIHDMEASALAMRQLKALGVQLAVDDFGTGHAGISYLRRFPIDIVKLDRTFITPNALEPHGFGFMKALSDMAHALGLHVVAEGVEDKATLALLCKAQCDEAQGYLFAKPLPLLELLVYTEKMLAVRDE